MTATHATVWCLAGCRSALPASLQLQEVQVEGLPLPLPVPVAVPVVPPVPVGVLPVPLEAPRRRSFPHLLVNAGASAPHVAAATGALEVAAVALALPAPTVVPVPVPVATWLSTLLVAAEVRRAPVAPPACAVCQRLAPGAGSTVALAAAGVAVRAPAALAAIRFRARWYSNDPTSILARMAACLTRSMGVSSRSRTRSLGVASDGLYAGPVARSLRCCSATRWCRSSSRACEVPDGGGGGDGRR